LPKKAVKAVKIDGNTMFSTGTLKNGIFQEQNFCHLS
jgi:hypothetical protein